MRSSLINRGLGLLLSVFVCCSSIPAQYNLGPNRLVPAPAPTIRNRTRLAIGLGSRPRLSFVRRIGGVAADSVAMPSDSLKVRTIALAYSPSKDDGNRLSLIINGEAVAVRIYDWQLIPIARFANSDSYSCFTLFGELQNKALQAKFAKQNAEFLNYHPAFVNTLMGLRLFQLDTLIINQYSYDLVKDGNSYILGAGESAPDLRANRNGLATYRGYAKQNVKLFNRTSYVISDYRRQVIFDVQNNFLNIQAQPSYYFWTHDTEALQEFKTGAAQRAVINDLFAQVQKYTRANPGLNGKAWLIDELLKETRKYELLIGDDRLVRSLGKHKVAALLATEPRTRQTLLSVQSADTLVELLADLRILARIQRAKEVPELSKGLSSEPEMLRAINPAVWDAGANLIRYAAFFRYAKQRNPSNWRTFMLQIKRAPKLEPAVKTPTVMLPAD